MASSELQLRWQGWRWMILLKRRVGLVPLIALAAGCSTSKVTQTAYARGDGQQRVRGIAILPNSGIFIDDIGIELSNLGYTVLEPQETATILGKAGSDAAAKRGALLSSGSLAALRSKNVDAILTANLAIGQDGRPQTATVRLTSTASGGSIAAVSWENGWAGFGGSPADHVMRKDAAGAASEIADALVKNLRQ
jgi:hypothetical protein